jgi:adenylate cyclase
VRAAFFASADEFLNGDSEARILKDIDRILVSQNLTTEEKKNIEEVKSQVPSTFAQTRGVNTNLAKTREILAKNLADAFCIIGNTGTSTTDIGVNPFEKEYMNVGTHAAVTNTILQGQFLNEMPWWYSTIIAVALSFAATFAIIRLNPLRSILLGFAIVVVILALGIGYFLLTGVYIDMLSPLGNVFLTFVVLTAIKFLRSEKEKSFVRNAFGHYLSTDVINDLLSNPDKLKLGGEKKLLTAMFTDVKGFSSISEVLDPMELVRLLNLYLTEMSNIILDLRGTIDTYEGDAIISFFGAPIDFDDHARRACLSAIRIKRAEQILNRKFLDEKLSPSTLHTRIGINTGEMVVGNMGTLQKMDYTIMGNSVNLAARLEGVNKQYGTWLMMSDVTYEAGGSDFLVRKLDRVRVVGINKPVRLYELVEEKGGVEKPVDEAIKVFHAGLDLFEAKKWDKAEAEFNKVLMNIPEDGPAKTYIKRCQEFRAKAPAESWDGVFNLTAK